VASGNFFRETTVYLVMTGPLHPRTLALRCVFASSLFCGGYAVAQHKPMDCTRVPTTHVKLAEGDQNNANHLQVSRRVTAGASIDLDVCAADLTIKAGKDDMFRVTVDFENAAPKLHASDYLQALDFTEQAVNVKLYLPKSPRAKVVVVVPVTTPKLEVNLVRGDLSFETDRIAGERKINVVSGHVDLLGNADSYATLHASVLMGSFHDHRQSLDDEHGIVSKSLSGTGKGSIEIDVVRGSVDLKAWD
jgi:hypothetical protein